MRKGTVSGKIDSVVNTASTIEFLVKVVLYLLKSVDNKNGGITLKRVAVGVKAYQNEVAPSGSIKRYQLSEERIYGHDDKIPKDKVEAYLRENLQLFYKW